VLGAASNAERDRHMTTLLDRGFDRMDVPSAPLVAAIHLPWLVSAAQATPMPIAVTTMLHTVITKATHHSLARVHLLLRGAGSFRYDGRYAR